MSELVDNKSDFSLLGLTNPPKVYVQNFLDAYFAQANAVLDFEKSFIEKNGLQTTEVDYFKLRRFINTALRHFKELDDKFLTGLLLKLQKDVYELFDFISELITKTKMIDLIFNTEFLQSVPEYVELEKLAHEALNRKQKYETDCNIFQEQVKNLAPKVASSPTAKAEYRKIKLQLGDAAHYFAIARDEYDALLTKLTIFRKTLFPIFTAGFKEEREEFITGISKYASAKAFYLDKLMWQRAQQNPTITAFMRTAGVEGDYDMKTFLKYYLRNVNAENSADKEWHLYLQKAMEIL